MMIILGLGCNIGDRLSNLRSALAHLRLIPELLVSQVSPVYESDALLPHHAAKSWDLPYLNLALNVTTYLGPEELLERIKAIEKKMERVASTRWSPRVIDIDILAWGQEHYHTEKLTVPQARLIERPFALWPLADLAPDWQYCEPNQAETGSSAGELVKKFGSRFNGRAPLNTRQINHRVDTPIMMGILNLTPDSFSDGGQFNDFMSAITQIENLFDAGADIIDIGAESTRPSGDIISVAEEWSRLQPLLDTWSSLWGNRSFRPKLSIDTRKPEIAAKLLSYPVDFFNDVSGLVDPKMQAVLKESTAKIIFMHNLGVPVNPEVILPSNLDVVSQVYQWGQKQLEHLVKIGIPPERLIFDVGIGFGKDANQSLALMRKIKHFHKLGVPILVGHSRKSFLNQFTPKKFAERDLETVAFSQFLAKEQVDYLRVHNVEQHLRILKINATLCNFK